MLKKTILVSCLILNVALAKETSEEIIDAAVQIAKGTMATLVALPSAEGCIETYAKWKNNSALDLLLGLGYGYSLSKLAPYARESFLLKSPTFINKHTASGSRAAALIKGAVALSVAGASLRELLDQQKSSKVIFKAASLFYTIANGAQYGYTNIKYAVGK